MEITEKTGKLLTVFREHREDLSISDVVDIMYSGYECFKPDGDFNNLTKEWAVDLLNTYETGRQKIPTDDRIAEVVGGAFSVMEMKKWALKAVCHFYRCGSADKFLLQLGLLEFTPTPVMPNDNEPDLRATDVCELAVWEWFGDE